MRPEREGIIWALLTDDERAEMPTKESREWYHQSPCNDKLGLWLEDDSDTVDFSLAYRPLPKPMKKFRPLNLDEMRRCIGRVVTRKDDGSFHLLLSCGEAHGEVWFSISDTKDTSNALLDEYEFRGSPCGVEITNE